MTLPSAATLAVLVQRDGPAALDAYAPAIDGQADLTAAAAFMGVTYKSARTLRSRTRADGSPAWPKPDAQYGQAPVWTYRTLVLFKASAPGRGAPGRERAKRAL